MKEIIVGIKGMSCASCASNIERSLNELEGILKCSVNFTTEKVSIQYDPSITSIDEINKTVKKIGYSLNKIDLNKKIIIDRTSILKLIFIIPFTSLLLLKTIIDILKPEFSKNIFEYNLVNLTMFIVASLSVFWVGNEYILSLIRFIKYRKANMYTLIGLSTIVSYIYSSIVFIFPELITKLNMPNMTYFDIPIIITGFVSIGKYLENKAKISTNIALKKLANLQVKTAKIIENNIEFEKPIGKVNINEYVIVKSGEKIPLDGMIVDGSANIDESMMTGEPIPKEKSIDDFVIGGTLNLNGTIIIKVTKNSSNSILSQIIKMVEQAQNSKAPIPKLADKISEYFTPIVLIISFISFTTWVVIGPVFITKEESFYRGFLALIEVLVIACPCALGLATPTAIITGTGKGASNGILIKDAESLQKLSQINTLVTDKTGTITNGKPQLVNILPMNGYSETQIIQMLYSIERFSEHPLAKAIVQKSKELNITPLEITKFTNLQGKGISAYINKDKYTVGNLSLVNLPINKDHKRYIKNITKIGQTPVIILKNNDIIGIIGISDTLKPNIHKIISKLKNQNIDTIIISGDNINTVKYVSELVGITKYYGEVLPNEKAQIIKNLQKDGKIVAMVGDGINDAPALAQADIGIAMSNGSDIAIDTASITLLDGDFSKIVKSIKLSKNTINTIKVNLFWAFGYNIITITIATGILYPILGITLNPIYAGISMIISSLTVLLNSLRLKDIKL